MAIGIQRLDMRSACLCKFVRWRWQRRYAWVTSFGCWNGHPQGAPVQGLGQVGGFDVVNQPAVNVGVQMHFDIAVVDTEIGFVELKLSIVIDEE